MSKKSNSLIYIILILIIGIIAYIFLFRSIGIEKITLNKKNIDLYVGEKSKINVSIEPENATNKKIKWTSNNPMVATVDDNGVVSGLKEGEADILVSTYDNKISESCHVIVKIREIEKILLSSTSIVLKIGDRETLNASVIPSNATYNSLLFRSSDESVVIVDSNGNIEAKKNGVADIIVTDIGKTIEAKCSVVVGVPLNSISFENSNVNLVVGKETNLKVIYNPIDTIEKTLTWKSSNENVVIVDNSGKIYAKELGNATITATSSSGKIATCNVTVEKESISVSSVSINKDRVSLEIGNTIALSTTVLPSNANNKSITWKSSDTNVATVDNNGKVTANNSGTAIITATAENGKSATCGVIVKSNPIVPSNSSIKYEGSTLKYYVQNKVSYYLTYIWMEDPYNQIKKMEATTSRYGKIMSDEELTSEGKKPVRRTVGEMMNSYINNGMISTSKAVIGFNASAFYVSGVWNPPSEYYNNRSDSWFVLNEGKITRKRINESDGPRRSLIGIDLYGNLKMYGSATNPSERQKIYDTIMNDKVKNTFSFGPEMIKNGVNLTSGNESAQRQAICQIDSNNYVMYTTINKATIKSVADVFIQIGCKTAFNLDGGGSTSLFYKKPGTTSVTKVKCSDGSSHTVCRSIVEGIYFTEK